LFSFAQSDPGNTIAQMFGMKEAVVPIVDSANFIVSQVGYYDLHKLQLSRVIDYAD
jgi:hypothetical protein